MKYVAHILLVNFSVHSNNTTEVDCPLVYQENRLNYKKGGTCTDDYDMPYFPASLYSRYTCQVNSFFELVKKNCSCIPNYAIKFGTACFISTNFFQFLT